MSTIKQDEGGGDVNGDDEFMSGFVVASGDAAILLELFEELLDQVPGLPVGGEDIRDL